MDEIEKKVFWFMLIAIILLIVWGTYVGFRGWETSVQCKRAGYRSGEYIFLDQSYCHKRVDQTDTIIPLKDLKNE